MSEDRVGQEPDDTDDLDALDDELGLDEDEQGEPELEAPELEIPPEPPPEPPPVSRETRRIRALRQREKDAQAEVARLRQQNEQLLTQFRQPAPQPVDPYRQAELERQEAERLAMMDPVQAARHIASQERQRTDQQLARMNVETFDRLDRITWDNIKSRETAARRLDPQVEQYLAAARAQGMNPTRENIYNLLMGQEIRARASRQTETQRRNGARRIASQRTNGATPRSGVAGRGQQRGEQDTSAEADIALLRGISIGQLTGDR